MSARPTFLYKYTNLVWLLQQAAPRGCAHLFYSVACNGVRRATGVANDGWGRGWRASKATGIAGTVPV